MKTINFLKRVFFSTILILVIVSCTKDNYSPTNSLLKKVKQGDFITEEISYNNYDLISEVNSTSFWRKFYYNDQNQLIKEEVATNPDIFSSSMPSGQTHDFVDPNKVGISLYRVFEYDNNGRLNKHLNYVPRDGQDELRSIITFEYNANNLIEKLLLHDGNAELTQFRTYQYDSNSNVIEEDYYSYLFIPAGTDPKHISKTTFIFDSYLNPYKIFEKSSAPGLFTNKNNITKSITINYDPIAGQAPTTTSQISYEYNEKTRYPIKVNNGEEYIYE